MSFAAALPASDDTNNIVDAALARVREEARLDAEPVLPPLEVLLPARMAPRKNAPERPLVVVPTPVPLPSPEAIVAEVARKNSTTVNARRERTARAVRWPVVLCGFIASVSAGAAFMRSPVGHRPEVVHAVVVTKGHAVGLYQATKHAVANIAR